MFFSCNNDDEVVTIDPVSIDFDNTELTVNEFDGINPLQFLLETHFQ